MVGRITCGCNLAGSGPVAPAGNSITGLHCFAAPSVGHGRLHIAAAVPVAQHQRWLPATALGFDRDDVVVRSRVHFAVLQLEELEVDKPGIRKGAAPRLPGVGPAKVTVVDSPN